MFFILYSNDIEETLKQDKIFLQNTCTHSVQRSCRILHDIVILYMYKHIHIQTLDVIYKNGNIYIYQKTRHSFLYEKYDINCINGINSYVKVFLVWHIRSALREFELTIHGFKFQRSPSWTSVPYRKDDR